MFVDVQVYMDIFLSSHVWISFFFDLHSFSHIELPLPDEHHQPILLSNLCCPSKSFTTKAAWMCQPSNSATVVFTFEAPAKLRVTKFEAGCKVLGCVKLDHCVPHEVCRPVELQKFVLGHEAAHYFLCSGTFCISRVPAAAVHQISEFCHRFT